MRMRDVLLLGILFLWFVLVIAFWIRRKKRGGCMGCGRCSCEECSSCKEKIGV